ncbi:MAG: cytochrome b N-terminal domain-containing protein [Bacteriodetes bacterium]|nr:cytochrome b N-terminal domain-containing protein [Bacteroidota bacterium]
MNTKLHHKVESVNRWFVQRANLQDLLHTDKLFHVILKILLATLVVQCISGMVLTLYYQPNAEVLQDVKHRKLIPVLPTKVIVDTNGDTLYQSIQDVVYLPYSEQDSCLLNPTTNKPLKVVRGDDFQLLIPDTEVDYGLGVNSTNMSVRLLEKSFVRTVHIVSSYLLVCCIVVVIGLYILRRYYQQPFELLWVYTSLLFIVVTFAAWSGSVLPWDIRGHEAAMIVLSTARTYLPLVGDLIEGLLNKFDDVKLLPTMYSLHVVWMPTMMLLCIYGMKRLVGTAKLQVPVIQITILSILLLASVTGFTVGKPFVSGVIVADNVRPEWYFAAPFFLMKVLPADLAVTIITGWISLLVCLPILSNGIRNKAFTYAISITLLLSALVFTVIGNLQ